MNRVRNWPMQASLPEIAIVCVLTEIAESILLPVWLYKAGHAVWIPAAWVLHTEPLTVGVYCLVVRPLTIRTAQLTSQILSPLRLHHGKRPHSLKGSDK